MCSCVGIFLKYQNEFQYGAPMSLRVSALTFSKRSLKRSACMAAVWRQRSRLPSGDLVNQRLDLRSTVLFLVPPGDLWTAPPTTCVCNFMLLSDCHANAFIWLWLSACSGSSMYHSSMFSFLRWKHERVLLKARKLLFLSKIFPVPHGIHIIALVMHVVLGTGSFFFVSARQNVTSKQGIICSTQLGSLMVSPADSRGCRG